MRDPFPPSPVLHLTSPQAGTQPTLKTNAQHLARRDQSGTATALLGGGVGGGGGGQASSFGRYKPGDVITIVVGKSGGAGSALSTHTQSNKPRAHIAEGIEAHWARLHTSRQIETSRAINRGLLALTAEIDAL